MARVVDSFLVPHPVPNPGLVCPGEARCAFSKAALFALSCALAALLAPLPAFGQVLTIDTSGNTAAPANAPVDHQYQQIQPTHVALSTAPMDERDRLQLVRLLQAEQGFAMRPLPGGHKGLTLEANGELQPAGEAYLNMATADGISIKPGGRAVITNVRIDRNKLIFDLNEGPDAKHRFLRHISIGGDPDYDTPVVNDTSQPGGARVTLSFKSHIPSLTGDQVKALLAPLISFDVKTPVQAYTDTLPKPLKQAILDHQALVGMNTDMLMFAKGEPQQKYHEMDGQMPIDIWIYGKPPEDVTFVRINGNQVIRVELARTGQPLQVYTKNLVAPMLTAAGQPSVEQAENVHVIQEGDVHRNPDTQEPAPPPSLRNPGETLPNSQNANVGVMKPVYLPKQQPDSQADPYPNGNGQGSTTPASGPGSGQSQKGTAASSSGGKTPPTPAAGSQANPPANEPATVGSNPDDQQH